MATGATNYRTDVSNSEANTLQFVINQSLLRINTLIPCKIIAVNGLRYTVQILTNTIDATYKPHQGAIIYDIPAMQIVGNMAGIIIEYVVNDVVIVGFCQRDISVVKQNWTSANPGSLRKFSVSDGIILGYISNSMPDVFIQILNTGITITSNDTPITLNPGTSPVTINGNLIVNGTITATDDVVINSLSFNNHIHNGTGTLIDSITFAPISGTTAIPS